MSYWDTSALAKLYLPEPDSPIFDHRAVEEDTIRTSRMAVFEILRTALRKQYDGTIRSGTAEEVRAAVAEDIASGRIHLIEVDTQLEPELAAVLKLCYSHDPPVLVRTIDALHLASARLARETHFVATDKRLRQAAKLLGLRLFPD